MKLKSIKLLILAILTLSPTLVSAKFTDVPTNLKQYDAISALENEGVIKGYNDGTYRPNQLVTRAELLKMTFNHIGFEPTAQETDTKLIDVPKDSWIAPYVKKALELGAVNYNPDVPKFFPDQPISKIEALKMVLPLEGVPTPYFYDPSETGFKDVRATDNFSYLVRAAQNAGIFSGKTGSSFYPFKNLTRADAAYLLYQTENYDYSSNQSIPVENDNLVNQLNEAEKDLINNPKFPIFVSVWNKINSQYVDPEKVDKNELLYGAVDGMVQTLNDEYSIFEKPTKATILKDTLSGSFEGVGLVLDNINKSIVVTSVLKNSPAQEGGIKTGDTITKIDGKDIANLKIDEVISLIKGAAGTKVSLTISRDNQTLQFNLTRRKLTLESVVLPTSKVTVPSNLGYIKIQQFSANTGNEFAKLLTETLSKKPKGLILDLRNNPGGYLDTAYQVMEHFITKGQILASIKINGQFMEEKSSGPADATNLPLIVLVNANTASAAEVLAGAIQDYKLGKLVGEKTYGKGTVQEITNYSDGSLFKQTIAHWLTPLKRSIDKTGLIPDITVTITKDDLVNNNDPQLQKAIDLLE